MQYAMFWFIHKQNAEINLIQNTNILQKVQKEAN